jgi:hypothetical protein
LAEPRYPGRESSAMLTILRSAVSRPFRATRDHLSVNRKAGEVRSGKYLAPQVGLEPTTLRLTDQQFQKGSGSRRIRLNISPAHTGDVASREFDRFRGAAILSVQVRHSKHSLAVEESQKREEHLLSSDNLTDQTTKVRRLSNSRRAKLWISFPSPACSWNQIGANRFCTILVAIQLFE